jgi:ATP-dependent protease HslVU (ClpYQ) peptidase subunit
MSVVVCKIQEGSGYEIASDSISVRGITQTKGDNTKFAKLFEENDLVVGGVGLSKEIALLQIFSKTHKPYEASESAILDFISEFSSWKKEKTGEAGIENQYLIGFEGSVFYIAGWLVRDVKTYEAIGAGMDYALTALYLGKSCKEAVEVAIELSIFCEGPVNLIVKSNEGPAKKKKNSK